MALKPGTQYGFGFPHVRIMVEDEIAADDLAGGVLPQFRDPSTPAARPAPAALDRLAQVDLGIERVGAGTLGIHEDPHGDEEAHSYEDRAEGRAGHHRPPFFTGRRAVETADTAATAWRSAKGTSAA